MDIATKLKKITEQKLLIKDIARFCKVSTNTVRAWRDGMSVPKEEHSDSIEMLTFLLNGKQTTNRAQALQYIGHTEWS